MLLFTLPKLCWEFVVVPLAMPDILSLPLELLRSVALFLNFREFCLFTQCRREIALYLLGNERLCQEKVEVCADNKDSIGMLATDHHAAMVSRLEGSFKKNCGKVTISSSPGQYLLA
jgi:hypothetical protein